mgnify:CR=1 FL=1
MFLKKKKTEPQDLRTYLQFHLDLYNLGRLVTVKGPDRGGKNRDQSWFEITIVYEPPGVTNHLDHVYIQDVFIGYNKRGGYLNRRNIRIALEKEARRVRKAHELAIDPNSGLTLREVRNREREAKYDAVWKPTQLAITSGKSTSIEL